MKFLGPPSSGSVAAQTYSRNPFGPYVRARVGRGGTPLNSIAGGVSAWRALTFDQQLGWDRWSSLVPENDSLGRSRVLAGCQRFLSAWLLAVDLGISPPTSAPLARAVSNVEVVSLYGGTTQQVKLDIVVYGSARPQVHASYPGSSLGTTSPPGRGCFWREMTVSTLLVTGAQTMTWVMPTSGRRCFARVRVVQQDWIPTPWSNCGFVLVP